MLIRVQYDMRRQGYTSLWECDYCGQWKIVFILDFDQNPKRKLIPSGWLIIDEMPWEKKAR
jgi:hypothetical protein